MFRTMRCKEHDHSSFYKFLQMEKNHKNTDCYFFYYSTCIKGDSCAYRHEASALGSETVCSYWQQGSCLNQHCNFRHMEIKKNRKVIPCYWEKFPTGCKKPHCPFLHRKCRTGIPNPIEPVKTPSTPAKPGNQEWSNRPDAKFDGNNADSEQGRGSSEAGSFIGSPVVDPLIVNFEEESDNESVPSPIKNSGNRVASCKTYEEIRLEEIQAESAAYYSYAEIPDHQTSFGGGKIRNLSRAKSQRLDSGISPYSHHETEKPDDELNFEVLSLEEIRRRKKCKQAAAEKVAAVVKNSEKEETEQTPSLRDTLRVLDHLRDTSPRQPCQKILKKRRFIELQKTDVDKQASTQLAETRIQPVRLKRLKRNVVVTEGSAELSADQNKEDEGQKATERLEDAGAEAVDGAGAGRRKSVEVRICDSSTDDKNTSASSEQETATTTTEVDNADGLDQIAGLTKICGSELTRSKGDLFALDASDDILKDIDALLTDDLSS